MLMKVSLTFEEPFNSTHHCYRVIIIHEKHKVGIYCKNLYLYCSVFILTTIEKHLFPLTLSEKLPVVLTLDLMCIKATLTAHPH